MNDGYLSPLFTEAHPFLNKSEQESNQQHFDGRPQQRRSLFDRTNLCLVIVHLGFIVTYSILFYTITKGYLHPQTALKPITGLHIDYIPQEYTDFEISPYAGPPSPSVDKAWHDLLSKTAIRVSGDELRRSNQTSVPLPDGGGYMAWLGAYHQLHCIKMLRQWNYREHYHPGLKPEDRPHWDIHADHCLDILRSAAMCHADTTLTTFGWRDQDKPMLNTRPIPHKCVNWDSLMKSVEHRFVSKEEVAALVNPNF